MFCAGVNFDLAEGERVGGSWRVGRRQEHLAAYSRHPRSADEGKILFGGKQLPLDDEAALCEFRNRRNRLCLSVSLSST